MSVNQLQASLINLGLPIPIHSLSDPGGSSPLFTTFLLGSKVNGKRGAILAVGRAPGAEEVEKVN